jgi:hypothetical protein
MEQDAWFFIGVFIFIFIIWIATGGPFRSLSFSVPEFPKPTATVAVRETSIGLPQAPFVVSDPSVSGSSYRDTDSYASDPDALPVLNGITFGPPSSYRGVVTLSNYVSNASSTKEYLELSVSDRAASPINITNWQVVSETTGKSARIPQGTPVPTSGIVNRLYDIFVAPGERAVITTGRSPIGVSFRENVCTGYFSTFQTFSPPLPQNCPDPMDELKKYYGPFYFRDTSCVEYVESLPRCETVLFPQKSVSKTCKNFVVEHLNYNGCVRTHQTDPDFAGDTWRIFLSRTKPLWRARYEIIKLWDLNGKTVDAFSY